MEYSTRRLDPGWDNDGEPGNQVPTKSSYSTEIFCWSPAFWQNMYRYEYIWAEKDQINNFLSYFWPFWWVKFIKMVLKVHNSRLLGRNIWKILGVPMKRILLSHHGKDTLTTQRVFHRTAGLNIQTLQHALPCPDWSTQAKKSNNQLMGNILLTFWDWVIIGEQNMQREDCWYIYVKKTIHYS